jgi:hypothetical protein
VRRIGKFRLANMFLQSDNICVRRLMAKIIVMDVIRRWDVDAVEYIAYCDEFEPVEPGCIPPEYEVICSGDPIVVSFKRRDIDVTREHQP